MLARSPVFEIDYRHDRRAHRHRCRCCGVVVNAGERVIMARVADRKTWVLHLECGDKRHSPEYSWREVFCVWADEHRKR